MFSYVKDEVGDAAEWRFRVSEAGVYELSASWPGGETTAHYRIHHAAGVTERDLAAPPGGHWNVLGAFRFDAGVEYAVEVQDGRQGEPLEHSFVPDAMKLVLMSQGSRSGPEATARASR